MRIGELNERITFRKATITGFARNGDTEGEEAATVTCWAKVTPLSGYRQLMAEQVTDGQPFEIVTRYDARIAETQSWIIEHRGNRLKINGIPVNESTGFKKLIFRAYRES